MYQNQNRARTGREPPERTRQPSTRQLAAAGWLLERGADASLPTRTRTAGLWLSNWGCSRGSLQGGDGLGQRVRAVLSRGVWRTARGRNACVHVSSQTSMLRAGEGVVWFLGVAVAAPYYRSLFIFGVSPTETKALPRPFYAFSFYAFYSQVFSQLSTVHCPLSTVHCPLSTVHGNALTRRASSVASLQANKKYHYFYGYSCTALLI